jgi:hypothetical protein
MPAKPARSEQASRFTSSIGRISGSASSVPTCMNSGIVPTAAAAAGSNSMHALKISAVVGSVPAGRRRTDRRDRVADLRGLEGTDGTARGVWIGHECVHAAVR